jgi:surfeit locus 1 family protein
VILRMMLGRRWWWTTLLVVLGAAVCVRLGIWQLDRLRQRRAFNTHVQAVWDMPPLQLTAATTTDLTGMEYRSVQVSGTYDFDNQIALRNQYWADTNAVEQYGYHLLTPLLLDEGGPAVIVDRGWIPAGGNDSPTAWQQYDQSSRVTLKGVLRLGGDKPEMGGVPDPQGQTHLYFWNSVNLERIQAQLRYPILSVYIQPDPEPERNTPPYPFQPTLELSEGPHMGYAIQWFSFAALLVSGYPFYLRKQANSESEMKQ